MEEAIIMDTAPQPANDSPPWRSSRVRRSPKPFEGEVILYKPGSTSPSEVEQSPPVEVRTTKRKRSKSASPPVEVRATKRKRSKSTSPQLSTPKKSRRISASHGPPESHSTSSFIPTPITTPTTIPTTTPMDDFPELGSTAQNAICIGSPSDNASDKELEIMADGADPASIKHTGQLRLDESQAGVSKRPRAPSPVILNLPYGSDSSDNEPDATDPSYDLDWDDRLSDPVPGTGVYLGEFKSAKRPRDRNVVYAMLDQFDDVAIQVLGFNRTGRPVEDAVYRGEVAFGDVVFRSGFGEEWLKNGSMGDVKKCARDRLVASRGKA